MSFTAVVQIGNSDDKLTQAEWSDFFRDVGRTVAAYGSLHFSGCSNPVAQWQNACFVVVVPLESDLKRLHTGLSALAGKYRQDSIALTVGPTTFVSP